MMMLMGPRTRGQLFCGLWEFLTQGIVHVGSTFRVVVTTIRTDSTSFLFLIEHSMRVHFAERIRNLHGPTGLLDLL
uniref:Uncharacterized protein n=1 Tax=Lepeophtheirus salmonis TaxID=72036 RepID=A0A0K2UKQ5_LEPSM